MGLFVDELEDDLNFFHSNHADETYYSSDDEWLIGAKPSRKSVSSESKPKPAKNTKPAASSKKSASKPTDASSAKSGKSKPPEAAKNVRTYAPQTQKYGASSYDSQAPIPPVVTQAPPKTSLLNKASAYIKDKTCKNALNGLYGKFDGTYPERLNEAVKNCAGVPHACNYVRPLYDNVRKQNVVKTKLIGKNETTSVKDWFEKSGFHDRCDLQA